MCAASSCDERRIDQRDWREAMGGGHSQGVLLTEVDCRRIGAQSALRLEETAGLELGVSRVPGTTWRASRATREAPDH